MDAGGNTTTMDQSTTRIGSPVFKVCWGIATLSNPDYLTEVDVIAMSVAGIPN